MKKTKIVLLAVITGVLLFTSSVGASSLAESVNTVGSKFNDLQSDHWSSAAVSWGADNKIIDGYDDGTFRPDKNVTGSEFLTMLVKSTSPTELVQDASVSWDKPVVDYARNKNWVLEATDGQISRSGVATIVAGSLGINCGPSGNIQTLLEKGLSNGKTDSTVAGYEGRDQLTRAEAITFVYNYSQKNQKLYAAPKSATVACTSLGEQEQDKQVTPNTALTPSGTNPTTTQGQTGGYFGGAGGGAGNSTTVSQPVTAPVKNPLVSGNYSISTNATSDSKFTLTGNLPKDKIVWAAITKVGGEVQSNMLTTVGGKLNAGLSLSAGAGEYKMVIYEGEIGDRKGPYPWAGEFTLTNTDTKDWAYLGSTAQIQTDNPEIVSLAKQITAGVTDDVYKTRKIHDWVTTNIRYDTAAFYGSKPKAIDFSAVETLHAKSTVCAGYANLTAALNRAVGIRTKVIDGGAYWSEEQTRAASGKDVNHNWVEVSVGGRWMIQDTTWDAGYIFGNDGFEFKYRTTYYDPRSSDFAKDHIKVKEQKF